MSRHPPRWAYVKGNWGGINSGFDTRTARDLASFLSPHAEGGEQRRKSARAHGLRDELPHRARELEPMSGAGTHEQNAGTIGMEIDKEILVRCVRIETTFSAAGCRGESGKPLGRESVDGTEFARRGGRATGEITDRLPFAAPDLDTVPDIRRSVVVSSS